MTEQVSIKIKGIQSIESEAEELEAIELVTTGKYYRLDEQSYVEYEEKLEDSTEVVANLIKIGDNILEVDKKGLIESHMIFKAGTKTATDYKTPYGIIQMGVITKQLEVIAEQDKIDIKAEYILEANEEYAASCKLEICVTSK